MDAIEQIHELFYSKIPITRSMGVRVELFDGVRLTVSAPLEPNINHLGTAFGASINALCVLSGYGLLWLALGDPETEIIVRESSIAYDRPVRGDIRATCALPDADELAAFKQKYERAGKSRITLTAIIEDEGAIAARFRGTFFALRPRRTGQV
jgi:thioesterase domain-containing protein